MKTHYLAFAILLMPLFLANCVSSSEVVSVANKTSTPVTVTVIFGLRSGFAPTGIVDGPGGLQSNIDSGSQRVFDAGNCKELIPLISRYPATVIMVRPKGRYNSEAFVIPQARKQYSHQGGQSDIYCHIIGKSGAYLLTAVDESGSVLEVRSPTGFAPDTDTVIKKWEREVR